LSKTKEVITNLYRRSDWNKSTVGTDPSRLRSEERRRGKGEKQGALSKRGREMPRGSGASQNRPPLRATKVDTGRKSQLEKGRGGKINEKTGTLQLAVSGFWKRNHEFLSGK